MKTFEIKWETMTGSQKWTSIKAESLDAAIRTLCKNQKVGNVLGARDCYRVQWL